MNRTIEASRPQAAMPGCLLGVFGFIVAAITGAISAVAIGYAYFFVANRIGFDFILVVAPFVGAAVGWAIGIAARLVRFRFWPVLLLVGFTFSTAGYAARYYFEFNDLVETIVNEEARTGSSVDETRQAFLEQWAERYPPGGFLGYFQYLANEGITLTGERITSFDPETGTASRESTIEGLWVWGLFGLETLFAGVFGAGLARVTALEATRH